MRAGGNFIHLQTGWSIEELDRQHAHVIETGQQGSRHIAGEGLHGVVHRGRQDNPVADLLVLVGLHQGPAGHVALPIPAGHQGELLLKGHHFLQDPVGREHMVEEGLQGLLIGQGDGALAVVPTAAGLGHQGKAESGRQGGALLDFGRAIRTRTAPERGPRRLLALEESHRAGLRRGKHLLKITPTWTGQVELIE